MDVRQRVSRVGVVRGLYSAEFLGDRKLLGWAGPACSSDCRCRLDENATTPTVGCLGELNATMSFPALCVTFAFSLEEEAMNIGAPNSCDCLMSVCGQDDVTAHVTRADALCDDYFENDLEARPCVGLDKRATNAAAVK